MAFFINNGITDELSVSYYLLLTDNSLKNIGCSRHLRGRNCYNKLLSGATKLNVINVPNSCESINNIYKSSCVWIHAIKSSWTNRFDHFIVIQSDQRGPYNPWIWDQRTTTIPWISQLTWLLTENIALIGTSLLCSTSSTPVVLSSTGNLSEIIAFTAQAVNTWKVAGILEGKLSGLVNIFQQQL